MLTRHAYALAWAVAEPLSQGNGIAAICAPAGLLGARAPICSAAFGTGVGYALQGLWVRAGMPCAVLRACPAAVLKPRNIIIGMHTAGCQNFGALGRPAHSLRAPTQSPKGRPQARMPCLWYTLDRSLPWQFVLLRAYLAKSQRTLRSAPRMPCRSKAVGDERAIIPRASWVRTLCAGGLARHPRRAKSPQRRQAFAPGRSLSPAQSFGGSAGARV